MYDFAQVVRGFINRGLLNFSWVRFQLNLLLQGALLHPKAYQDNTSSYCPTLVPMFVFAKHLWLKYL